MMKRFIAWVLVIVLLVSFAVPAFANDKDDHDKVIKDVLFGENRAAFDGEQQEKLNCLLNAVAICLDQYNGNYKNELQKLIDSGIQGIPESISAIDFLFNQHHRQFTHKGWNYKYSNFGKIFF